MEIVILLCIVLGLVLLGGFVLSQMYNRLVLLKNRCDNGFSQIEVQLKRRYDLIPNLVESVRGYLTHERETLESVIAARNQAANGLARAAKDPGNAAAMQSFLGGEGALAGALGRLNFVMEDYPELKASQNVSQLTEELTHTENRVAFARQAYNDLVMVFNTYRQSFPVIVFAGTFGHAVDREMLVMPESAKIQEAPKVSFATATP
jgi:LemA protein